MTASSPESGPASTRRPARRAPTDLPITITRADLDAASAGRAEPAWLHADRATAFDRFEALPVESNRLYTTYVDFRAADLAGARLAWPSEIRVESDAVAGPDGVDGYVELREGEVAGIGLSESARAAGVILGSLPDLVVRDPERIRVALEGAGTLPAEDKLAQLTRALWGHGILLDVPAGVVLERPILLRWAAGIGGRAGFGRAIIRLGAGASATIVEELVPSESTTGRAVEDSARQALLATTTEALLAPGASLAVASVQDLGLDTIAFQHRHATIGEGADLRWAVAHLGGRLVRGRVDNTLLGDRSSVEQVEIVFGSDDQFFDLTSYTRHVGRDTTGNMLSKAAMLDASRVYFKGLSTIERSARGTDSFLGEYGMLLSKQSRSVAIPSLEIDQPDCRRAGHASSVGPIDPLQLFYLESRGIAPDEARRAIVLGFLEPVVARVPLEAEQSRLRELLEAKWSDAVGSAAGVA